MNKPLLLACCGLLLVAVLFFFGRTSTPPKTLTSRIEKVFNVAQFIDSVKGTLSPSQSIYVGALENSVKRGDIKSQQSEAYTTIANFWRDSLRLFEPYVYYSAEAAKLDNSEKSLTFAARLFLEGLRAERDQVKLNWMSNEAISLFEKALVLNPGNDDLKIGLGSVYVFGRGRSGNPQATMKGIQLLLSVARKDPGNLKAQLVLGVGGLMSGQYDKALERFKLIVEKEPDNVEAVAYLADTYAALGNKTEAIRYYKISRKLVNDPNYDKEVDERIMNIK